MSDRITQGLRPTPRDERDFAFGAAYWLPELSELPEEFILPTKTYDQGDSDHCTAYMTTNMSSLQEGVDLDQRFSFMASKYLSGDPEKWGQDLRVACKSHVKIGALAMSDVPDEARALNDQDARYRVKWPNSVFSRAYPHRKEAYFDLTGPYDHFDNARASIWKLRNLKTAIGFGMNFGYRKSDVVLDRITGGVGHAQAAIGWTNSKAGQTTIVVQGSLGEQWGDAGRHYITRDIFNHFVEKYQAFLFTDLSKKEAARRVKYNIYDTDGCLAAMIKYIKHYV